MARTISYFSDKLAKSISVFLKNSRSFPIFQKRHGNFPFQQPSTSYLFCPVRTWHDGQRREKALAADRSETKRLKVKHDNYTKRQDPWNLNKRQTKTQNPYEIGRSGNHSVLDSSEKFWIVLAYEIVLNLPEPSSPFSYE